MVFGFGFAEKLRRMDLRKAPSIAETIDWGRAIVLLGASALDPELVRSTLGVLIKHAEDHAKVLTNIDTLTTSRARPKAP